MHGPTPTPPARFQRIVDADTSDEDFFDIEIGGRKARVFKPRQRGQRADNFWIKGYPPSWGKRAFYKSTGFSTKGLARDAAKQMWGAVLEGRFDALKKVTIHQPERFATIGEVIAAFLKSIHAHKSVGRSTVKAYCSSLRRLVIWARHPGLCDAGAECERLHFTKEQLAVIDRESAEILNADLIEKFLERYLAPAGSDVLKRQNRINGALAAIRFARAMFDKVALEKCYRELRMPSLDGFLECSVIEAPKRKPQVITDATVREMGRAINWLREAQPELYLVHLLCRHFGLGNDEIENALVGWIQPAGLGDTRGVVLPNGDCRPVAAYLSVKWRSDWHGKTDAREGRVAISADVYAELLPWVEGRRADELLVPAVNKTARANLIDRAHASFMRHWVADFTKRGYELRRWSASKVAELHQNEAKGGEFLRHAAKSTAARFYLKEPVTTPIILADCGLAV